MKNGMLRLISCFFCAAFVMLNSVAMPGAKRTSAEHAEEALRDAISRLAAIEPVPIAERRRILADIDTAFSIIKAEKASLNASDAKKILTCLERLSADDFGDARLRDRVRGEMVLYCLSVAKGLDLELEDRLVGRLPSALSMHDAVKGEQIDDKKWRHIRNQALECRLRLWKRVEDMIDPSWNPEDAPLRNISPPGQGRMYPAGAAPESIKEPEVRRQYEAALEANRQKAERYSEQRSVRRLRDRYKPQLKEAIADAFGISPVSEEDLDTLKEYLRRYVPDERLRNELFKTAQAASPNDQCRPVKPSSAEER